MNLINRLLSQGADETQKEETKIDDPKAKPERMVIKVVKNDSSVAANSNKTDSTISVKEKQADAEKERDGEKKLVKMDINVDFNDIYKDSDVKIVSDNIEMVISTIDKIGNIISTSPVGVIQSTVKTTLEVAGLNVNNIKEDGTNKIAAIKKYKDTIDQETDKYISEKKNIIAELEKQIERHKMDVQNKKNLLSNINKRLDSKIQEMSEAINFISFDEDKANLSE